jgi:hypothetical protein
LGFKCSLMAHGMAAFGLTVVNIWLDENDCYFYL